jgi:two-component system OmpR family response regulator
VSELRQMGGPAGGARQEQCARVLVVDDESHITDLLTMSLKFVGFEVTTASTAREGLRAATSAPVDVILLDVMLPDMEGFEVCKRLRSEGVWVPIIFLTARDALENKVNGLTLGGDDYITKPFSLEELVARIRAVLRRTGDHGQDSGRLRFADLELDEDSHMVWRQGTPIELSPTEFRLLNYLMLNPNRVLSKAQILDRVWQYDFDGDSGVVETFISYLRKKVDSFDPPLIHTRRGVGYMLRLPGG